MMTDEEFYKELSYVNASRENRLKYANLVLNDMSLFPKLLDIIFLVNDKVSAKAAWVFEFVCCEYVFAIVPHLEKFTNNIKQVHLDSAVRPVSKVCEFIATAYYSKEPNPIKKTVTSKHKELIIETCFDWMISNHKVATKAYAMETLFLFGKEYKWVHPELAEILEQDFHIQSAGYKARAKRTLLKIKKFRET